MCPCSRGRASSFAGAPIAHLEDVRLLGPTFIRLPSQAFYVKNAVVPEVTQMAPAYAAGGGGAERLLGPYDVLDTHAEEVEVRKSRAPPVPFRPLGAGPAPHASSGMDIAGRRHIIGGGESSRLNAHRCSPFCAQQRCRAR